MRLGDVIGTGEVKAMGDNLLPTNIHPGGREVWLRSVDTVFSSAPDGSVMRHIGIAFNITLEKTAELDLRKLNAELEERMRERTQEIKELDDELEAHVVKCDNELVSIYKGLEQLSYVEAYGLKVLVNSMASLTHMLQETTESQSEEHAETLS